MPLARRGDRRAAPASGRASRPIRGVQPRDRDRPGPGGARRRTRRARLAAIATLRDRRSVRTCATGSRRCSRPLRTARFAEADAGSPAGGDRRGGARSIRRAASMRGDRDAVLRAEPRLGAGAGGNRPGDHLRRHGRHQHGPRRADDAGRLHHVRRAAGDARTTSAPRFSWPSRRRSSSPALAGVLIERTIIRFLYGRPLETLLATFGVSLRPAAAGPLGVLARTTAPWQTPPWMSGTLQINEALAITYNRLYIVLFTMIVFAILLLVLQAHPPRACDIRAVAQNRAMARAMGIRSEWVDAMTFGLGSGIAGVAGVALSQLTNVGPEPGPGLHHRLVHGRGVRRRRQSVGHADRRHVAGHRQQAARAVRGRGARRRSSCWSR